MGNTHYGATKPSSPASRVTVTFGARRGRGIVETELFAPTYRNYGLATVRYPVLEVTATVEPYENGRGFSLRVLHAGKPRASRVSTKSE